VCVFEGADKKDREVVPGLLQQLAETLRKSHKMGSK
jgi:hypothetical protein